MVSQGRIRPQSSETHGQGHPDPGVNISITTSCGVEGIARTVASTTVNY